MHRQIDRCRVSSNPKRPNFAQLTSFSAPHQSAQFPCSLESRVLQASITAKCWQVRYLHERFHFKSTRSDTLTRSVAVEHLEDPEKVLKDLVRLRRERTVTTVALKENAACSFSHCDQIHALFRPPAYVQQGKHERHCSRQCHGDKDRANR